MRGDDRVRVEHMIEATEAVADFINGRRASDLETDRMLLFAVVRAIEVIGEAAARVSVDVTTKASAIPWRAIISMRNRLVHGYFDIDTDIVWTTATTELPALLPHFRALLEDSQSG
ncbi:MAG: DUF86 domain-containing protein [Polyangia bacterium]